MPFSFLQIQRKQKGKTLLENKCAEYKDRIDAMAEHLKNVKQELLHTQVTSMIVLWAFGPGRKHQG